jgi:urea transport system permease protein
MVPGILAFVFGWLAFRSRVTGVYLSILTQAMTLALSLYLFQNDSGLRGNNGLSGLQNIPRLENFSQAEISIWFLVLSSLALLIIYFVSSSIVNTKLGNIIIGIRDNENRIRFLGYKVENYKLFIFVISAVISGIAGALYYPQAGIINPAELAPLASIYLAVWVAIGGRGSLYGAIIGAAFVSLTSSYFTGGQIPNIEFGIFTFKWVDWWVVILGFSFVITTLYAPRGIGGLIEYIFKKRLK